MRAKLLTDPIFQTAHIGSLRTILMTYHTFSSDLGYVQGMSDLLSPLYVVYDADESSTFWAFVEFMKRMESNFLRDQSGMKAKLSTLQQLVHMMDPKLYRKLEITNSTSMFISFRGVLINYKREFKFEDVIVLWDVLFTDFYSTQFVLFVALAVLHSHRDIIIRYLMESDEVLKYINDLSQTVSEPESSSLCNTTCFLLKLNDHVPRSTSSLLSPRQRSYSSPSEHK